MMNASILPSREEIDLAGQVEKSLAKEGIIVPGSLQTVPRVNSLISFGFSSVELNPIPFEE